MMKKLNDYELEKQRLAKSLFESVDCSLLSHLLFVDQKLQGKSSYEQAIAYRALAIKFAVAKDFCSSQLPHAGDLGKSDEYRKSKRLVDDMYSLEKITLLDELGQDLMERSNETCDVDFVSIHLVKDKKLTFLKFISDSLLEQIDRWD